MAAVKNNQNVFDLALQEFGNLENLFSEVLVPNNLALDRELKPDQEVNMNTLGLGEDSIKNEIQEQGLVFTNEEIAEEVVGVLQGIDYDIIGNTLIVY